jgi:hypothetical protein
MEHKDIIAGTWYHDTEHDLHSPKDLWDVFTKITKFDIKSKTCVYVDAKRSKNGTKVIILEHDTDINDVLVFHDPPKHVSKYNWIEDVTDTVSKEDVEVLENELARVRKKKFVKEI